MEKSKNSLIKCPHAQLYNFILQLSKDKGIQYFKRCEYQIDSELSIKRLIKALCETMPINRSGYCKRKNGILNPSKRTKKRMEDIIMFKKYHEKYSSHGYRWLNAKILLDTGQKNVRSICT